MFDNLIKEKYKSNTTTVELSMFNELKLIEDEMINFENKQKSTKEKKVIFIKSFQELVEMKFSKADSDLFAKQNEIVLENEQIYCDFYVFSQESLLPILTNLH
jgi:hypothetical protein